ncbi:MAG: rod shape-determining protein RodA [Thermoanaerobaculia bacterium]
MRPTSASIPAPGPEGSLLGQLTGLDWAILVSGLALAVVGLATVHSASAELPFDYLPRQAAWVALGIVAMAVAFFLDYRLLVDLSPPLYALATGLLVLVLVVGSERGGARSWLGSGGFGFQPAEVAKVATVLLLARYLAHVNRRILSVGQIAVAVFLAVVPMGLITVQPDLGTAAMFVPMVAGMLLVGGIRVRVWLAAMAGLVVLAGAVWLFAMQPYQRDRVRTFLEPGADPLGAGYQVRQSKIAVGSGQLAGRGYQQGTQSQLRFLPARHTDFIFAVLAEEWGFLGVISVLGLYLVFLVNGARVAIRARDREGILLVVGMLSFIAFHVLYNTAMVVGLVPITGIPLPFLSYGGSFTLVNFAATGLILGVDVRRYVNR